MIIYFLNCCKFCLCAHKALAPGCQPLFSFLPCLEHNVIHDKFLASKNLVLADILFLVPANFVSAGTAFHGSGTSLAASQSYDIAFFAV